MSRQFVAASSQSFHVGDNLDAQDFTWSVAAWVKPATGSIGSVRRGIVEKEEVGTAAGWALEINDTGKLQMGMFNGVYYNAQSAGNVSEDVWSHVGGIWHGDVEEEIRVFINGSDVGNDVGPEFAAGSATNLVIGAAAHEAGRYFDGLIAEIAIWDVELTPAQWTDLAGGASPLTVGSPIAYWSLLTDLTESVGALSPTNSGTTLSGDHPPMSGGDQGFLLVSN
jgi:hypothetical protein